MIINVFLELKKKNRGIPGKSEISVGYFETVTSQKFFLEKNIPMIQVYLLKMPKSYSIINFKIPFPIKNFLLFGFSSHW